MSTRLPNLPSGWHMSNAPGGQRHFYGPGGLYIRGESYASGRSYQQGCRYAVYRDRVYLGGADDIRHALTIAMPGRRA